MDRRIYTCLLFMAAAALSKPVEEAPDDMRTHTRVNKVIEMYQDAAEVMDSITSFLGTISQIDPKSTEVAREKASILLPEKRRAPGFQMSAWRRKRGADDTMGSLELLRRLDQEAEEMVANIYDFLDSLEEVRLLYEGTPKQTRSKGFKTSAW
ncbi:uncharacterized protein [Ptychodera flava]|uniref:uncharacterized protein n=1 Tax=Ptychodera flava TaxID=63121 RepID=UPI00396A3A76